MLHTRTTLLVASVVIAGCRSTPVSGPVLQPIAATPSDDTRAKSIGPWILRPNHQPHTYHSISQTTVDEPSNSTIRQNTIEIVTTFTISLNQSHTPLTISGQVDTVTFSEQKQPLPKNQEFSLPLVFEGELAHTGLAISVKNSQGTAGTCSPSVSSILGDVHTVINTYPSRLTPSLTWRDSTLVTTCTPDRVPTTRRTIQIFRVVGESALKTTRVLLIQRLDSTYISGDGTQDNHQIHLEGAGTGTGNIYIDPDSGVILATQVSEDLEITVTNSGKSRHFIQKVTQTVKATN